MLNIMLPAGDCILSSPSKLREPIHICADELALTQCLDCGEEKRTALLVGL